MALLIRGNRKLGHNIWHFSIPAGKTCPGKTKACAEACYAKKGFYAYPSVTDALVERDAARKQRNFVSLITDEIAANSIKTLRIHVSGDFDSNSYIYKWIQIADENPNTRFYFYTRSWRKSQLLDNLYELIDCPNVSAWFSCDKDTGRPPTHRRVGRAYMAIDNNDSPDYVVDLVFRVVRHDVVNRWAGGTVVCPVERKPGKDINHDKLSCETCRLCLGDKLRWLKAERKRE